MPAGYRKSTGNNGRLAANGRRARGGQDPLVVGAADSAAVSAALGTDPEAAAWMGWAWSRWIPAPETQLHRGEVGLYRLRQGRSAGLVYVGQGDIGQRVRAHLAKVSVSGHRQARWFAGNLQAPWVALPGMARINLLEHEADLIASHMCATGDSPRAQFLG
jgi:hypothetical protein